MRAGWWNEVKVSSAILIRYTHMKLREKGGRGVLEKMITSFSGGGRKKRTSLIETWLDPVLGALLVSCPLEVSCGGWRGQKPVYPNRKGGRFPTLLKRFRRHVIPSQRSTKSWLWLPASINCKDDYSILSLDSASLESNYPSMVCNSVMNWSSNSPRVKVWVSIYLDYKVHFCYWGPAFASHCKHPRSLKVLGKGGWSNIFVI